MAVDSVDFAERVAILVVDNEVAPAEAERQALGEILGRCLAEPPPGILGELVLADRRRRDAAMQDALAAAGVVRCRAPAWGFGHVVPDGRTWRPAAAGEAGRAAAIVPATEAGALVDLVAQDLETGQMRTRLDVAAVLGLDEIDRAKLNGRPLLLFPDALGWLRGGCRGAVVVDWRRAGHELQGVPAVLTASRLVARVIAATRDCRPRPIVATPHREGVARAA